MDFHHISVLLNECIEGLNIKQNGIYVDGTTGGAGHSTQMARKLAKGQGQLICFDRDPDAIKTASERLEPYGVTSFVEANFSEMSQNLTFLHIPQVNGVLLDLGVSSHQLDTPERGFSYNCDAPLDMRMSQSGISAKDIVNTYELKELTRIIRDYSEEKFAYSIAKNIIKARQIKPVETTFELTEIIKSSMPAAARRDKNPSKRTFQALRIAVNTELDSLSRGLDEAFACLAPGGRLVVITFHSLEDRIVKHRYNDWCKGCICPPGCPVCICNNKPKAKLINKKPILASEEELAVNKRSRSAKLRILEKI